MMRPMMRPRSLCSILACFLMLMSSPSFADAYQMSYGGRLTSDVGAPVEGPVDLLVSFYNVSVGGSALTTPLSFDAVELDEGLFQIDLNLSIADINLIFPVNSTSPAYVEITAIKNGVSTIYPRQKFSAVPYALRVPVDGTSVGYNANGKLSIVNVDKLQGRAVSASAPTANDVLSWDGEKWLPVSAGTFGGGTVTSVASGTGLTGGTITGTGTISLENTAVSPGSYTKANITVDAQGRLTAASNGTIAAGDVPALDTSKITTGTFDTARIPAVDSAKITDGAIMNADVNDSAAIATSKLSGAVTSIASHGLGTMATQAASSVAITGGAISSVTFKPVTGTAADCDGSKIGMQRFNTTTTNMEFCNGTGPGWTSMNGGSSSIPTGTIAFFNRTIAAGCPSGWTKMTSAQGRYIVGMLDSGAPGTTVGTAFTTSTENRTVGQHGHGVSDPEHSHGIPVGGSGGGYQMAVQGGPSLNGYVTSPSATTGITIQDAGSVAGTNAPYIQYLACEKQ